MVLPPPVPAMAASVVAAKLARRLAWPGSIRTSRTSTGGPVTATIHQLLRHYISAIRHDEHKTHPSLHNSYGVLFRRIGPFQLVEFSNCRYAIPRLNRLPVRTGRNL